MTIQYFTELVWARYQTNKPTKQNIVTRKKSIEGIQIHRYYTKFSKMISFNNKNYMTYKAIGKYDPFSGGKKAVKEIVSNGVQMLDLVEKKSKHLL